MYAVIETGGKQYRVEVGTELEIERLETGPGQSVAFDRVLLVADGDAASIGRPVLANATVSAEVVRLDRGDKVVSFKYRPKARRRVKKGHRQELTLVRISDIVLDGKSAADQVRKAEEDRKTERQRLEEGARRQAEQDAALAAKLAADRAKADKATSASAKASTASATTKADKATTAGARAEKSPARASKPEKTAAGTTPPGSASPKARARKTETTEGKAAPAAKKTTDKTRTRKGGEG